MNNQDTKRLFLALNIPPEIKAEIGQTALGFIKKYQEVKWVEESNYHLTLHFLGNIFKPDEEKIKVALQSFENKFSTLNFETGKLTAFPNLSNPKIIYLECKPISSNSVYKLHELVGIELAKLGFKIDKRPWKTHLTLGRAREGAKIKLPEDLMVGTLKFSVTSLDLMESKLGPSGAQYTILEKYKFL